jgi:hypothetical protein
MNNFEAWANRNYKPAEASLKRPSLFIISAILLVAVSVSAYTQINNHWTNDGIWIVFTLFAFLSILGLFVSIGCKASGLH